MRDDGLQRGDPVVEAVGHQHLAADIDAEERSGAIIERFQPPVFSRISVLASSQAHWPSE